uniref:protein-tyrosine-phosphatase n=1 Tax=Paramormyrops kingsleyae TaxID=1676925 RepID=A0A3B3RB05_9TELE
MSSFYTATRMMRRPSLPCVALTAVLLFAVSEGVRSDVCTPCTDFAAEFVFPSVITVSTGNCTLDPKVNGGNFSYFMSVTCAPNNDSSYINNSYNLTNVTLGENYTFNINASFGNVSYSVTLYSYTYVNPLTNLRVVNQTTGSIGISWDLQPNVTSAAFSYSVSYNNSIINTTSKSALLQDLQPGTPYNISVMIVIPQSTSQVTVRAYTRPDVIRNLTVTAVSTTSVSLSWAPPVGNAAFYSVLWNDSSTQQNTTSLNTSITISNLTAGTQYTFSVTAIAGDNQAAGAPTSLSQYTNLPKPSCSVSNRGTNNSIDVTWTALVGHVEHYVVNLTSQYIEASMISTCCLQSINDLAAGTVYNATVIAISGPVLAISDPCSNATYPNEPGTIIITNKTVSSISLTWSPAVPPERQFNYIVSYETSSRYTMTVSTNSATLSSLLSGTPYNISVITVGPLNLTSKPVWKYLVTTLPGSVQGLQVFNTSMTAITLNWSQPMDYNGYQYMVMKNGTIIKNISAVILYVDGLSPGTCYPFSVITLAADGTGSAGVNVTGCTDAAPPEVFKCDGPNGGDANINISWQNPAGNYNGYEITIVGVNVNVSTSMIAGHTSFTWFNLAYSTTYTVMIMTVGPGKNSTKVSISCKTGVTVPSMINVTSSVLSPSQVSYNRFVLTLQSSIFDNSHGHITHVGVLVAIDGNTSDKQYLSKSYDVWNANKVGAYLAVVNEFQGGTSRASQADQISITVGDNSLWNAYQNGALQPTQNYRYSIVAFTSLILNNNFVDISQSFFSLSGPASTTLPQNPAVIGGAVGGVLAVLVILIIAVIIGVFFWRRKQPRREITEIPIQSMRAKVSMPIRMEDFETYYRKQRANSNCGFAEEFEDLKSVGVAQSKNSALILENKGKNRYNNVLPYDFSRVKLSVLRGAHDDYINANYMPGYFSRKEFVAAQGPLACTVSEFWRMIWEQNVHTLVMLTRCNEQGRVKCEEYWPQKSKHFDNISVTITSSIVLEDWTIRDFDVKNVKTAEIRSVRQFHFTAWPDHGVPQTTELLINFRHLVREHMDQYSRNCPTVVHCSAGVGRTGTFIAIDRLIYQIERESIVDVFGTIHDMRMHRPLMVQTEEQYVFLNQCAMDIIKSRTGTNVDLIYQNTAALAIYENVNSTNVSKKNAPKS